MSWEKEQQQLKGTHGNATGPPANMKLKVKRLSSHNTMNMMEDEFNDVLNITITAHTVYTR